MKKEINSNFKRLFEKQSFFLPLLEFPHSHGSFFLKKFKKIFTVLGKHPMNMNFEFVLSCVSKSV